MPQEKGKKIKKNDSQNKSNKNIPLSSNNSIRGRVGAELKLDNFAVSEIIYNTGTKNFSEQDAETLIKLIKEEFLLKKQADAIKKKNEEANSD